MDAKKLHDRLKTISKMRQCLIEKNAVTTAMTALEMAKEATEEALRLIIEQEAARAEVAAGREADPNA